MQRLLRWGVIPVLVLSAVAWAGPVELTESADDVDLSEWPAAEAEAGEESTGHWAARPPVNQSDQPKPVTQSEPTALPVRRATLVGEDHLDLDVAISPGTILNVGPDGVVLIEWDADSMQLTRRSYRLVDPRVDAASADLASSFINVQPITSNAPLVDEAEIEAPQISLIPEPAGLTLLAMGLVAITRGRRVR